MLPTDPSVDDTDALTMISGAILGPRLCQSSMAALNNRPAGTAAVISWLQLPELMFSSLFASLDYNLLVYE